MCGHYEARMKKNNEVIRKLEAKLKEVDTEPRETSIEGGGILEVQRRKLEFLLSGVPQGKRKVIKGKR